LPYPTASNIVDSVLSHGESHQIEESYGI